MPLGNGDIGLNVWVEASGDILFYIGKTDSWDDNNRLVKIGRVRVSLRPNPFAGTGFRQELRLHQGEIVIDGSVEGKPVKARIWVDANNPVIHVETEGGVPLTATAAIELWRTEKTTLPSIEVSDTYYDAPKDKSAPTVVEPDFFFPNLTGEIAWCHHNIKSVGPELSMRFQDLLGAPWKDPLLHRTFGALIRAEKGRRLDDKRLEAAPAASQHISIFVLTQQPATPEAWLASVRKTAQKTEAVNLTKSRAAHLAWWAAFWDRSHIDIRDASRDGIPLNPPTAGFDVSRGYALQRFINACSGRGAYPIKFNGNIFTVGRPGKPGDADYRLWGPGYWWQNSRLPYIGSCASGDFDLMQPFFGMYAGEVFEVSKYRTRRYFGHPGAYFAECIFPWGAVFMQSYGWQVPAAERQDKLQVSGYHKWEWVAGPELAWMMLEYFDYTGDRAFLRAKAVPLALEVMTFFDRHYKTDAAGKLIMNPSQALETWWDCTNPMPEVAGLHAVAARVLALPEGTLSAVDRTFVAAFQRKIPELPVREVDGVKMLSPAEKFADKRNVENPELYAVYPFRLSSFEKPNAALGRQALARVLDQGAFGWRQDDIFKAYLGLAEGAQENVVLRARKSDPDCRFPAFWGPNYDWTPDQDHGGVLVKAVQSMLVQTEGKTIFLLPAWPRDWDVDFKLHAPFQTVIEGRVQDGKLQSWKVTPNSRRMDVVVGAGWKN
jgi:alpha-L-fucosidase 2